MRGRVHARRTLKGLVADLRQVRKYKELTATEKLKYRIAVKMTAADYFRLLTRSHEAGVSPSSLRVRQTPEASTMNGGTARWQWQGFMNL